MKRYMAGGVLLCLVLALAAPARAANSIGINAASTYANANAYPIADGVTQGLVDNSHWNNIGTGNTGEGCGSIGVGNLVNSDGLASGAALNFSLCPFGPNGAGNTIIGNGPGDSITGFQLFKGGLSSHYGRWPYLSLSNIPYATYDVILYLYKANSMNIGGRLQGTDAAGAVDSTIMVTSDGGVFTAFDDATTDGVGNYIKWSSLTGSSFTLAVEGGPDRAQFVAMQIVEGGVTPPVWPNYLPGDFNKDGQVGPEDFGILKDTFGTSNLAHGAHESWTLGDANDDGQIGPEDFGLLKDSFGLSNGPTGTYPLANVPEPLTLVTLMGAGLPMLLKRRAKG